MKFLLRYFNRIRQKQVDQEHEVLAALLDDRRTISEISDFTSLPEATVFKTLVRLERGGEVYHEYYMGDNRKVTVKYYYR